MPLVTLCLLFRCHLIDKRAAFLNLLILRLDLNRSIEHSTSLLGLFQLRIGEAKRVQIDRFMWLLADRHIPFLSGHMPHAAIFVGNAIIVVDKMLARIGLADSVTDATRKIKAGAVEINGVRIRDLLLGEVPAEMIVQVGKHWRRVTG